MRIISCLLLLATTASAGTSRRTTIVVKQEGHDAVEASLASTLSTKGGTKLDACWTHDATHTVTVELAKGRVTKVEHADTLEKSEEACLTRTLKAQRFAAVKDRVVVTLELTSAARGIETKLGTLQPINTSGTGTIGTGVSTRIQGTGTGSGGTAPGDSVANGSTAKLELGTSSVDGALSADLIDRVIKSHAGVLRACYQKELAKTPKLAGKITMAFNINATGTVVSVKTEATTLKSAAVESCVANQIQRMRFPASGEGTAVHHPFVFASQS